MTVARPPPTCLLTMSMFVTARCSGRRIVSLTTQCNGSSTDLVCIDCYPNLPDHSTLDVMTYEGWDCNYLDRDIHTVVDSVLDGTTEVGNQTVTICGMLPVYQQYIHEVAFQGANHYFPFRSFHLDASIESY